MINYNPEGKWSVESVQNRYRKLSLEVGGVGGYQPEPNVYTNPGGTTWIYNIMESVVDGIQLGDMACVQLSIEYIQDNIMGPTTGYIRERMARALRNSELTNDQKKQLANIFLNMLHSGQLLKEFREYCRLFKVIGVDPYQNDIEQFRASIGTPKIKY